VTGQGLERQEISDASQMEAVQDGLHLDQDADDGPGRRGGPRGMAPLPRSGGGHARRRHAGLARRVVAPARTAPASPCQASPLGGPWVGRSSSVRPALVAAESAPKVAT
jgi:hypothetical protein